MSFALTSSAFGLVMLGLWIAGLHSAALTIYAAVAIGGVAVSLPAEFRRQIAAIRYGPDFFEPLDSARGEATTWRQRVPTHLLASTGSAGVWPFVSAFEVLLALRTVRKLKRDGVRLFDLERHFQPQFDRLFEYEAPQVLVKSIWFALQSAFLAFAINAEAQAGAAFAAAATVHLVAFVAFTLHFHGRGEFLRNFSRSRLSPSLLALAAALLALTVAVMTRGLYLIASSDAPPPLDRELPYSMIRGAILNASLFDLGDAIRRAETTDAFAAEIRAYAAGFDRLKALDLYLAIFVIAAFARALWSAVSFRRDASDRLARAAALLCVGEAGQALEEARATRDGRVIAAARAYAGALAGDYEAFRRAAGLAKSAPEVAAFGDDVASRELWLLSIALKRGPVAPRDALTLIDGHFSAHGARAGPLILTSSYAFARRLPFAPIARRHGVDETLRPLAALKIVNDVYGVFGPLAASGKPYADAIRGRFGEDCVDILIVAAGFALGEWTRIGGPPIPDAQLAAAAAAFRMAADDLIGSRGPPPLPLILLGRLIAARAAYDIYFKAEATELDQLIEILRRRIEDAGCLPPVDEDLRVLGCDWARWLKA